MTDSEPRPRGDGPSNPGDALYDRAYPPELRAAEVACIKRRRERARSDSYQPHDPTVPATGADSSSVRLPDDSVGMALSGGGIRSATFCLGLLQSLAAHGLLRRIDFLSTVSGGGYVGAFLGALIQRREAIEPNGPTGISRAEVDLRGNSSAPIRWLRDHGRYLSPNGAGDEVVAGAVYLRNLAAIHVVMAMATLALLSTAMLLRAWVSARRPDLLPDWHTGAIWWSPYFVIPIWLLLLTSVPIGWAYWFVQPDNIRKRHYTDWMAASTAALILLTSIATLTRVSDFPGQTRHWALLLTAVPLGALLVWVAVSVMATRQVGVDTEIFARSKLSQWLASTLIAVACLSVLAFTDTFGQSFYLWLCADASHWYLKVGSAAGTIAGLLGGATRLTPLFGKARDQKRLSLPLSVLAGLAAATVIGGTMVSLATATHFVAWDGLRPRSVAMVTDSVQRPTTVVVAVEPGTNRVVAIPPESKEPTGRSRDSIETSPSMDLPRLALLTVVAGLLSALFGLTLRFVNNSSHQALYANRLTRAYLGASNPQRFRLGSKNGQRLSDPIQGDNIGWGLYAPHELGGPLHIVNVTVNETVLGASQIEQRDRKGLPMAIGPSGLSGSVEYHALWKQMADDPKCLDRTWQGRLPGPSTDWIKPIARVSGGFHMFGGSELKPHEVEALAVGTWAAISGAAFTTGLGARTSLGLSLLFGVANVRLGYWWDSHIESTARDDVRTEPTLGNRLSEYLNVAFPVQSHLFQEFTARFFGPHRRRWYLTDGGHFENTACYELLRRRVPFIVACDVGQDEVYAMEDLASLVRKARIDLCAEVRFWSRSEIEKRVRPSSQNIIGIFDDFKAPVSNADGLATGFSRVHALVADVFYDGAAEPGSVILFVKPSLTGDEPLDILQYRQEHRAFPQESTKDQYFDEAQWESYRSLGEHIGQMLFQPAGHGAGWSPADLVRP